MHDQRLLCCAKPTPCAGVLLLILLHTPLRAAEPASRPSAPKGYSWAQCKEINATLRPDDWFFKHEQNDATHAYFVTRESIENGGAFDTGLTLNVIVDVPRRTGVAPSEYAKNYLKLAGKKYREEKAWVEQRDPVKVFHAIVVEKEGNDPLRLHFVLIANDKTGTLHLFFYESPVRLWEKYGPVGETMLQNLHVDPER
jgi:hypothetical protein